MNEVYEFLKKAGTYYLATCDGDQPRVRPFGTVDLYNDRLYIQTGRSKKVADQLKSNPHAEICAFDGESGTWVRISGRLVLDEDIKAQEHMLEAYPSLKGRYAPGDGNTEVYYIKNAVATCDSFTSEPRVVEL